MNLTLDEFLANNRIDKQVWEQANIEWTALQAIADDYEMQSEQLGESAALFAKVIQKFEKVHSVRWRIKDREHLLEKIVRKRAEGSVKYADINAGNYFEHVTDLIGIRALHLFKEDCLAIVSDIKNVWSPIEVPVIYKRAGDNDELNKKFEEEGYEIKDHPAGYRSVHYVFESQPLGRKVITEVQVRTIFEEGWSEIDHKVRYPNFSENELIGYFLAIFNRMAGSADEMGGFVRGLVATINGLESDVSLAREDKEATLRDMEKALNQLASVKEQDKASQESITRLKLEVEKLKKSNQAGNGLLGAISSNHSSPNSLADILRSTTAVQARHGLFGETRLDSSNNLTLASILRPTAAVQAKPGLLGGISKGVDINEDKKK